MTPKKTPPAPHPQAYAQRLVLAVLMDAVQRGVKLTSRQIGERTATAKATINGVLVAGFPISDPRRTIAHLRERGYEIADQWDKNERGKGFKRYWLADPSQVTEPQPGREASDE